MENIPTVFDSFKQSSLTWFFQVYDDTIKQQKKNYPNRFSLILSHAKTHFSGNDCIHSCILGGRQVPGSNYVNKYLQKKILQVFWARYSIFDVLGPEKLFVYTAFWRNSGSQPMQEKSVQVIVGFLSYWKLGLQYT